jgi:3-oxo-4,17-pregnadiene-20-carboxyl-CoA hydratase alpha subunit
VTPEDNGAEKVNIETKEGQAKLRAMGVKPIPKEDDLTRPYWLAARHHELRIQRCNDCLDFRHPPEESCPSCESTDYEWVQISGRGVIYSFIIDHRLMVPGFDEPYAVIQVVPDEAQSDVVRITANLRDCALDEIRIGMHVEVLFEQRTPDVVLPQFRPASA